MEDITRRREYIIIIIIIGSIPAGLFNTYLQVILLTD